MQRTKQQALMFLLGAVLVGGALGFSADRYIGHEKFAAQLRTARPVLRRVGPVAAAARDARLARLQAGLRDAKAVSRRTTPRSKSIRTRFRAQRDSGIHEGAMARS